jgi:ribose transport system ATP-binding protein
MSEYLVEAKEITKTFPGVTALKDVTFNLKPGEVHVILGENGAGKSTLIKVLSGVYRQNDGTIYINGQKCSFRKPLDAERQGISTIYQEFNLVEGLSVAENIFLGRLGKNRTVARTIAWKKLYKEAVTVLDRLDCKINPRELVKKLGVAQKQMIEIAKAISKNSKILIMDEPTAVLTDTEISELFKIIDILKKTGVGIIYISHRLEEIIKVGDRITVLRDGEYIETIENKNVNMDALIKMMIGRDLKEKYPQRNSCIGEEVLSVHDIWTHEKLRGASLSVRKGEIVGLFGLVGSGRTELARAIFGADRKTSGIIYFNKQKIRVDSPRDSIKNGFAYLSEERKKNGLILKASVRDNIVIVALRDMVWGIIMKLREQFLITKKYVEALQIKTPSILQRVNNLSGGNQQKVVIAKWLCKNSQIFIFDEPTRGIDVGAKVEVYNLMNELVANGAAVLMISSELPEVLGMSDRIYVMSDGCVVGQFAKEDATQENLLGIAIRSKNIKTS